VTDAAAIRRASPDDVPAIRAILAAHGNDGPIVHGDVVGPYVLHLLGHHRAFVSELGGAVVAFGAAVDAGVATHLADLFVRPDLTGRGIGRPLLGAVFGEAERRTTFASEDPRALPVYVRAGMAALWVTLYMNGAAATIPPQPGLDSVPGDPGRLAALERDWTGAHRPADHAFWASQVAADAFLVVGEDGPLALGYARARQAVDMRALDRLVVRPGADPVGPALAAIHRAGRGGVVQVTVPGPSPLVRSLLGLGFRIADRDQFMASSPDLVDPARLLPSGGML
jgi:GNAT superfamily N-acetyltransferase